MYRMSIITMLCPPAENIEKDRCVKLALIHDMAEALVGDITPPDRVSKGLQYSGNCSICIFVLNTMVIPSFRRKAQERTGVNEIYLRQASQTNLRTNRGRVYGFMGGV